MTLKKQPHRHSSKKHADAIKEEVIKLKRAGAIKEVFYLKWLANTVVVKKKSGKWRVYVDFTNLNKAPQGSFLDPSDKLIGGCYDWSSSNELFGCLPGVSSDTINFALLGEDCFHDAYWELSLPSNAIWIKECLVCFPEDDD